MRAVSKKRYSVGVHVDTVKCLICGDAMKDDKYEDHLKNRHPELDIKWHLNKMNKKWKKETVWQATKYI